VIEGRRTAGVRIDRIAGASMGAVVAAAVAQEMSAPAIYEAFEHCVVAQNPSGDFTVPSTRCSAAGGLGACSGRASAAAGSSSSHCDSSASARI